MIVLKTNMKGQTRIIGEMLFFAVGVIILSYILITFGIVQSGVNELSTTDQLQGIANHIKSAIIKIADSSNNATASIIIELPLKVSGNEYAIRLNENGENKLIVSLLNNNERAVSEELFNIGTNYNIEKAVLRSSGVYYIINLDRSTNVLSMKYYKIQ